MYGILKQEAYHAYIIIFNRFFFSFGKPSQHIGC
jgi:hypothetical protein